VGLGLWLFSGPGSLKNERGNVSHTVSPRSHRLRGAIGNEADIAKSTFYQNSLQQVNDRVGYLHNRLRLSTEKTVRDEKNLFISRFVEVCGTSEAAKIQRLLNISYQAAKNYLGGRLPDPVVLRTIAERTPYSIHWLLTGHGEKLVAGPATSPDDRPVTARQVRELVRSECVEVINELMRSRESTQQKVVVLPSDSLKSEKVKESSLPIPEK
jgi:hypothetical protein